eukprot:8490270-Prorocentrum_lima.AAC.1
MSTTGTPLAGGPRVDPAGPRGAGRDEALGSRPCAGTPPVPEAAVAKLDAGELLWGGRARAGAPPS